MCESELDASNEHTLDQLVRMLSMRDAQPSVNTSNLV